ncbi:MAG TPA: ABC transporter permease [Candidatus Acidoferrum sp.]|nr:ABC transporter permease [Candidatus Acidoferrum sp.]
MARQDRNPSNQESQTSSLRADSHTSRGTGGQRSQWRAEYLLQDVRFALRTLRKSWGFTLTAVLTLALGIGANTAIFQLLDAVRLRSLPVSNPDMLAGVQVKNGNRGFGITIADDETSLTYPLWEQIRLHQQIFSHAFAWADSGSASLGEGAQERRARGLWVSGDAFTTLGIYPLRGRFFSAQDDRPGCGLPGAVISYGLWQSEFGGQDSAIGSKLMIDGRSTEVIGVTPRNFFGLEVGRSFDYAAPFCSLDAYFPSARTLSRKDYFWLHVLGRLKPGVTSQQASSELTAMSPGVIEATLPNGYGPIPLNIYRNFRLTAFPAGNGVSWLRETYDTSLWLLLAITALVLLIACANLANLMLARASAREREMAVRLALGASRWRLIRQLLSEGLLLAAGGAALGIVLAEVFSRSLIRFLSNEGDVIRLDLSLDWRVLLFTGLIAVLTCLVFGLVPAFRSSRAAPGSVLKSGSRGTTAGRERFSFQRLLVVSQIAVSVVLLVGALLFVRSFWNLATLDPGFRQRGILIATLDFRRLTFSPERTTAFIRELLAQTRALPQVESAATSTHIPLNGSSWNLGVHINGAEGGSKFTWVSPGYFQTMDIYLLAGRDFNERDTRTSPKVAEVNEAFVQKYMYGQNPIGKIIRTNTEPGYPESEYEIIGMVRDTRYNQLREPPPPITFAPAEQFPDPGPWAALFIRYSSPPSAVMSAVREKISAFSPAISIDFHVLQTDIENGLARERLMALLSGFFGALAALLAMIGLYGLISYIVATRKNEIGIRMALGASPGSVIRIIVRQTLTLLGVGVGAGLVLSMAAARGANSLLYGLQANDPLTLFSAAGFLAAVALAASYIPAYRASRVDPMNALRYE